MKVFLAQAKKLLSKSVAPINESLIGKNFLAGEFSGADIMLGHALYMANRLGCVSDELENLRRYIERIAARDAFDKAINIRHIRSGFIGYNETVNGYEWFKPP